MSVGENTPPDFDEMMHRAGFDMDFIKNASGDIQASHHDLSSSEVPVEINATCNQMLSNQHLIESASKSLTRISIVGGAVVAIMFSKYGINEGLASDAINNIRQSIDHLLINFRA